VVQPDPGLALPDAPTLARSRRGRCHHRRSCGRLGLAPRLLTPSTGQVLTATASASDPDDIAVADTPFDDETAATRTSLADAGLLAKAAIRNKKQEAVRHRRD
jgi:hypothetical protein